MPHVGRGLVACGPPPPTDPEGTIFEVPLYEGLGFESNWRREACPEPATMVSSTRT
jgi:hypothetical protein